VMKSTCSAKRSSVDIQAVQSKRLRVVGSRCGPIPWALRLLRDRKVDVQKYIHGVYPLERAEAALAHAAQRGTLKIQLVIR
jgi:threonine dehydrogenase-like Zn-dependent dehydrogenase